MKYILSLIISGALVVSGFGQTRNVLVGTNSVVVQPTNFWSADASNARSGLGLGTAATNPATSFQPSSTALSNIATGNGGALSNLQATNLVGIIPSSNIPSVTLTNIGGTLSVDSGGTGATNAANARTNLGSTVVGDAIFTATNAEAARITLSLGTAATSSITSFQPASANLTNLSINNGGSLTNIAISGVVGLQSNLDAKLAINGNASGISNITAANINGTVALASNITGTLSIASGGTGATNVANARQNLGSTTVGDAIFTASNAAAVRTTLSLGTASTSDVTSFQPANANLTNLSTNNGSSLSGIPISGIVNLQSNLDAKLAINGNASGLTNITAANINGTVALASNITGTAALATNVTGVVSIANGGTGTNSASGARASLGATTIGANLFTLANPDDVRFIRLNANNTVSSLTAADFRNALSIGTNLGTVTSIGMTVPSFLSVSTPSITSSGTFAITLNNQTSRQLLITPNGGGVPAFRLLESDDLPSLAISKITGLQTALDGKLSTTGTAALATNVTGTVAIANGGTGTTNATDARLALGLGTAATSAATSFQPSSSSLTNLAANNGGSLTNIIAGNVVGTVNLASNVSGTVSLANGGTGATNAAGARTSLELGTAATNPSTAFQASSSVLTNLAANNGGSLTNIAAANITGTVALASNITGTAPSATNVTGVVSILNGGTGTNSASGARTAFGATTVGANLFTLANPDDTRFIRLNANNSVSSLTAADMRSALSVGTNLGTVTSVGMTVPNIFSLSGSTITSSGTFALTLANQSSRQAFLVPNGGGIPSFRGIESEDLPSLAIAKITGLQTALDGKLSTTGTAALATNVTGTVAVANGGTGGTTAESGRAGLGATTIGAGLFTLANPSSVRFIRLNADNTVSSLSDSDFRTAIGLGTASTNPATAFQPASANLTTLSGNNGSGLTNLLLSSVTGLQSALDAKLATNGSASGLTNFPTSLLTTNGNGAGLTNLTAANITGLGTAATNPSTAFQSASSVLTNLSSSNAVNLTNLQATNIVGQIPASNISSVNFSNVSGTLSISSGGTEATNAATARTNLGLGWPALTNSNSATSLLGYNATNGQVIANTGTNALTFTNTVSISAGQVLTPSGATNFVGIGVGYTNVGLASGGAIQGHLGLVSGGKLMTVLSSAAGIFFYGPITFSSDVEQTRTNLGLGWSALTNTNTAGFNASIYGNGTNPVLVNTSGSVVSPTNFWAAAPISTTVQYQTNVTGTSTNAATNSRNLFLFSLAPSVSGITNTVTLPTNPATTFEGDRATITHLAQTTNAVTAIRQLGAATNLITLNQLDEAVLLMYRSGAWMLADNISYVEPIFFSGTNAVANAAASRTNLRLGWSALTNTNSATELLGVNTNGQVIANTGTNVLTMPTEVNFGEDIRIRSNKISGFSQSINFEEQQFQDGTDDLIIWSGLDITLGRAIGFVDASDAAQTRTNLGLPLAALTNTNNANFQAAVLNTNAAPTNSANVNTVNFNTAVAWMEVHVFTNGSNTSFRIPLFK
jgi:hypothetical protein